MKLLLAGLVVVAAARLFTALQSRNGSWARRGVYALLLLVLASAFWGNRRR